VTGESLWRRLDRDHCREQIFVHCEQQRPGGFRPLTDDRYAQIKQIDQLANYLSR
jgi:hypothetical protein